MKAPIALLFATIFCVPLLGGLNAQAQTLREAVCNMLEFEPELNAGEYDTLSSREDQKIARSKLFPRLSLNASSGVSDRDRSTDALLRSGETLLQNQVGVSLRQLLYDGGTARNESRASRNAFLAQQYLEKSMIETRVVDLSEVYLEVIRTRRQIELAQLNVANHERMRDMLKERVRAGGSRSDYALVQGRLGLATNTLATAKLSYRLAKGRFERLTGRPPGELSQPDIPRIPNSLHDIDLSQNHDYLAAVEALEAAEHRAKATRGYNRPQIYLDGNASAGRDVNGVRGEDNEVSALVVASWDLFAGGYNRGVQQREHFQVGKYEELKRTADLQRQYNLDVLWQEREGSLSSVQALQQYATELDGVAADYKEQFEVGRQELLNILDVQSETYTAQSRLLDARFDLDTSAYRILGVQGLATKYILGGESCEACVGGDKNATADKASTADYFEAADPDCRVPLTQGHLMNDRFDSVGPDAEYDSPRHNYYVERNQFPIQPSVDCGRVTRTGPPGMLAW
jgi:adhesin transport system outer membrane protein